MPGLSAGIRNIVIPSTGVLFQSLVRAKTRRWSAIVAAVIQVFWPRMHQPSPVCSARVFIARAISVPPSGSLMQKDAAGQRSDAEARSFGAALETMGVWYGHKLTTTFILSELPEGWPQTEAARPFFPAGWLAGKGWPSFERAVSGMLKKAGGTSWRRIVDPAVPRS